MITTRRFRRENGMRHIQAAPLKYPAPSSQSDESRRATRWRTIVYVVAIGPFVLMIALAWLRPDGFPATLNAVSAVREVFQERQLGFTPTITTSSGERYSRGMQALERISAGSGMEVVKSLQDIAPDLARFIIEFSYGDIIGRDGLDNRVKELATVALLTALGTAEPQLRVHVSAALNVGASRQEIIEVIQQMAVYAGFPAALNGVAAARNVFAAQTR
jgi:alkylhydroperoxidase/carboxymuconolactone decarboxylase family protein YurZ